MWCQVRTINRPCFLQCNVAWNLFHIRSFPHYWSYGIWCLHGTSHYSVFYSCLLLCSYGANTKWEALSSRLWFFHSFFDHWNLFNRLKVPFWFWNWDKSTWLSQNFELQRQTISFYLLHLEFSQFIISVSFKPCWELAYWSFFMKK